MNLPQKVHNLNTHHIQISINLLKRSRRRIDIEEPVKRNLVTNNPQLPILVIPLSLINPGIRHMGRNLFMKIGLDGFGHAT